MTRLLGFACRARQRWALAWPGVLQACLAAAVAWVLAQHVMGSTHPVFAPIAALVCLSPGVASRGRQAVLMMLGAVIGVVVGLALLLLVPPVTPGIFLVTGLTMMATAAFDISAVALIQAGASAILVAASGQPGIGPERVGDAAIGAAVGLLVSQVLLTPDPVALIRAEARGLLRESGAGLAAAARALPAADQVAMAEALARFHAANQRLIALSAAVDSARGGMRRWTLRGRLAAEAVEREAARYDHLAARIGAGVLLLGEALHARLGPSPPPPLVARLAWLARRAEALSQGRTETSPWPDGGMAAAPWTVPAALVQDLRGTLDELAPRIAEIAAEREAARPGGGVSGGGRSGSG
ncbi:FUSC family protein [Roseomonas sp. OT10]|uniref:FUSC family protein n=1 Tax=Roseomonas cutis TaxID=2897332 RepID=UPI001E369219|nr:FUSC family protein [Roseomonas sp. OT10]UFN50867.1 FUSC family protein [Roseomonas sp. OT10]